MSAQKIDRSYICKVESGTPMGRWHKQFNKDLKRFRYMNTQDEKQVMRVKRQASHTALQSLKLILAKQRGKLEDANMAIPVMLKEESAEKYVLALMTCHQLTLHLLAHDWSRYHCKIETWFCPSSKK